MTPISVVVLSCGELGVDVARRLRTVPGVGAVTVFWTPYRQPHRTLLGRVRVVYRQQGLQGFIRLLGRKLANGARSGRGDSSRDVPPGGGGVSVLAFRDFHDSDCLRALRRLSPDLGVVAGTYILRDVVFSIPRGGCINLHSGKVPEYRGAAPGFWELYNGESSVGITIHRVTARVDQGAVLLQESFPIDPAPAGDPMAYLEWYRQNVLRPHGIRLLAEAVASLAQGSARETHQDPSAGRTYRSPDRAAVKELKRRIRERRLCAAR